MPIYIGNTEIPETTDGLFVGDSSVRQVYVGTTLVWRRQSEPSISITALAAGVDSIGVFWSNLGGDTTSVTVNWGSGSVNLSGNVTSYNITGLNMNTSYTITVTGTNGSGTDSDTGTATTGLSVPQYTSTTFSNISDEVITISWTVTGIIDTQSVRYGTNASVLSGTGGTLISVGPGARTYTATGLDHDTLYYFRLEAVNTSGTGTATNQASTSLETFTFAQGYVDGSFMVDETGTPSAMLMGGATDLEFDPSSFDPETSDSMRTSTVSFIVPVGYVNTGARIGMQISTIQPGTAIEATSGTLGSFSPSVADIPHTGVLSNGGTHSIDVEPDGSQWQVVGTGGIDLDRNGAGDRTSVTWQIGPTTLARSGTITLRSGNGDLDVVNWNQLAAPVNATIGDLDTEFLFSNTIFILNGLGLGDPAWNLTIEANGNWRLDTDLPGVTFSNQTGSGDGTSVMTYTDGSATFGSYELTLSGANGNLLDTINITVF